MSNFYQKEHTGTVSLLPITRIQETLLVHSAHVTHREDVAYVSDIRRLTYPLLTVHKELTYGRRNVPDLRLLRTGSFRSVHMDKRRKCVTRKPLANLQNRVAV